MEVQYTRRKTHLGHTVGDVQELVRKELGEGQKNAGSQNLRVDSSNTVDVGGTDDGEVGHANLVFGGKKGAAGG
jgi:hypothetical protein